MTTQPSTARQYYEQQLENIARRLGELNSRSRRMVWLRTGLFLAAAIGLLLGYAGVANGGKLLVAGWLAAAGFMVAIVWHEHLRLQLDEQTAHQKLFSRLLARLNRDWDAVGSQALLPEFRQLPFVDDLDVGGHGSLLQLLSLAGTLPGRRTLQSWLTEVPSWNEVIARQRAAIALREHRQLRLSIIKTVAASSDGTEDVYGLPKWAAEPAWLPRHRGAHALSWLGPALFTMGAIVFALGLISAAKPLANVGAGVLVTGIVINLLVTIFWGSWIHDIFQRVSGQHRAVFQFDNVFQSLESLPGDAGLLDDIRQTSTVGPRSAVLGFHKLLWLVRLANLQRDPLMYVVYLLLQLAWMWDFRILEALERWQRQFASSVTNWFDALGRCEAIISSATLADEYPDWSFAGPIAAGRLFVAEQLGHPLLPDNARVPNDICIDSVQPLVLVTGSNMAGKSTFMRAVGLNQLLIRAGSPTCSTRMETHLYHLATSIRVRDSLKDGVSYFMAELRRLKEVVDLAHQQVAAPNMKVLFLLDEILQGTNSRERQIAVVTVLERLLGYGAAGFISTHDLDLATQPDIQKVSQIVHFREFFETIDGREQMRFDFKMRPGPTPTTNALKLLKLVGLDDKAS